jgi:DNA-binding winged helix-turn-helix (wHTH) protein
MLVPDSTIYEFGEYRFVPSQGLYRSGQYVALPPKELAVLCALIARRGDIVTKEQLIAEVWPHEYTSNESLTRCIYVLRRTLDLDGRSSVIQTVHRRGYRFAETLRITDSQNSMSSGGPTGRASTESARQAIDQCRLGFSRLGYSSRGDTEQAVLCFEKALRLDDNCALAYAGLGETTILQASHGWIGVSEAREMLRGMADMGRSVAPDSGEVLAISATVAAMFEWDWARAEEEAAEAERRSDDYKGPLARGLIAHCRGRTEEAIGHLSRAVAVAAYVPHCRSMYTWGLLCHGDNGAALEHARDAARMLPSVTDVFRDYAAAAAIAGRPDESLAAAERAAQLSDREPHILAGLVTALNACGEESRACETYAEVLRGAGRQRIVWSYIAPEVLLIEGRERCLEALETALAERCCLLAVKILDPRLKTLADEPRYQAIMRAIHGE